MAYTTIDNPELYFQVTTFVGDESSSLDTATAPDRQVYQVTVPSGKTIYNGTATVSVNGTNLTSDTNQTSATITNDFFISSSDDGFFAINKLSSGSSAGSTIGVDIDKSDQVRIKYLLSIAS